MESSETSPRESARRRWWGAAIVVLLLVPAVLDIYGFVQEGWFRLVAVACSCLGVALAWERQYSDTRFHVGVFPVFAINGVVACLAVVFVGWDAFWATVGIQFAFLALRPDLPMEDDLDWWR